MSYSNIFDPEEISYEEDIENFEEEDIIVEEENQDPNEPEFQVPDKFKDKEKEDIIKSYLELEKTLGRNAQELGDLRKAADEYLRRDLERLKRPIEPEPEEEELDLDILLENPSQAIGKAVEPKLRDIESRLSQYEKNIALQEFNKKWPDMKEIGSDPGFQEWVSSSPYRTRQFIEADQNFDLEAADELLTEWKERQDFLKAREERKREQTTQRRDKDLKNLTLESGSTGEVTRKVYRRSDLINLRNTDPERFDAMYEEISQAYLEGRVK